MTAGLLLLADGRLPAGGHAHSGGVEAVVRDGGVHDVVSLEAFLRGRLTTVGRCDASLVAWALHALPTGPDSDDADWARLDAAVCAHVSSPALRAASRSRGRQLLRLARRAYPSAVVASLAAAAPSAGPHLAIVYAAAARVAGLAPDQVAEVVAYEAVTGPATAAVRLLALDPLDVQALLVRLGPAIDAVASAAAADARAGTPSAISSVLLDVRAERHATWEVRLFAS